MNDFKKALGILGKAMQGSMFEKPVKVLGRTQSGKAIRDTTHTPESFLEHHKDWTAQDHDDASDIHYAHATSKFNVSDARPDNAEGKYHDQMANLHGLMALHRAPQHDMDASSNWGNPDTVRRDVEGNLQISLARRRGLTP